MKKLLFLIVAVGILTSCTEYYAEPRYDARDQIIGYYEMEEYSRTYREYVTYEIHILKNRYSSTEIYLNDFYAHNTQVYAYVNGHRITIPFQVSNGYEIEGSGTIYGSELRFDYRVRDIYHNTFTDYCEAIAYAF